MSARIFVSFNPWTDSRTLYGGNFQSWILIVLPTRQTPTSVAGERPCPILSSGSIRSKRGRIWQDAPFSDCSLNIQGTVRNNPIEPNPVVLLPCSAIVLPNVTVHYLQKRIRAALFYGSAVSKRRREYLSKKKDKITSSSLPSGERKPSIVVRCVSVIDFSITS